MEDTKQIQEEVLNKVENDFDGIEILEMSEAKAMSETSASSGISSCNSCSCCLSTSCCSVNFG